MIVSYNWLKELVKINVDPKKLSDEMSLYSCEVETFNKMVNATNLVVGEVLEVKNHENSDHLHICQVNLGDKVEQIVCGAPNVKAGIKVIVAVPGASLPGGTIKKSSIRGVESNGMICSLQELGIENKYVPTEYQKGIYYLGDDAVPGTSALEYLGYDDFLIELSLTPNRLDLMSMLGVAHDVKAMYNTELIPFETSFKETSLKSSDEISVELETDKCLSYYARVVKDVTIKESPRFIKARLIASGIRPINNVVDITNYVLMMFGQPLHAFDQDRLGNKIVVRNAKENEVLTTLDDIERKLLPTDIVITDGKESVCLAGVMGGKTTEVEEDTKNLVLECAVFDPLTVRKTSSRLGLRSESSVRYERGVDLNQSLAALNYACYLLEKYADAKIASGYVHKGISHIEDTVVEISEEYVEKYLGINIPTKKIQEILLSLDFKVEVSGTNIKVYVPNRRMDVKIKQDVIEEIARIYGYDKLEQTLPNINAQFELSKSQLVERIVKKALIGLGLSETITYSLVSKQLSDQFKILYSDRDEPIILLHPMTEEHSILRRSLVPSLLEVASYNNARSIYNLSLFELGEEYHFENKEPKENKLLAGLFQGTQSTLSWKKQEEEVDFFYVKGVLEFLFKRLNIKVKFRPLTNPCSELHPGRSAEIILNNHIIGFLGEVHPTLAKKLDIVRTYVFELRLQDLFELDHEVVAFSSISKVPSVERDLALVMNKDQAVGDVIETIYNCDKKLIKDVKVFDLYEGEHVGENEKSVAVRITLQSEETMTDEIINAKIKKILSTLAYMYKIELRK